MAAIALRRLALLLILAGILPAQPDKDVQRQVTRVAKSLTAGNPAEAMMPFDKSFEGYGQLSDYFAALTNAYQIVNEIEITDQHMADSEAVLTVHWVLTLSDLQNGFTETRTEDMSVKLTLQKDQWRIVGFAPLELFNPQLRKSK